MTKIKKTRNKLIPILLTIFLIIQIFFPVRMSFDPLRIAMQKALATAWYNTDWGYRGF